MARFPHKLVLLISINFSLNLHPSRIRFHFRFGQEIESIASALAGDPGHGVKASWADPPETRAARFADIETSFGSMHNSHLR